MQKEWGQTDDLQWRLQLSETEFHLVEVREFPDGYLYVSGIIDTKDYSKEEKESIIAGYYSSVEEFEESYPMHLLSGILAECIFEQTSEMELLCFGPYKTEELAEAAAKEYISVQNEYYQKEETQER